ncbi:MAG: cold shock domain-containing protein [Sneathiella sp.]
MEGTVKFFNTEKGFGFVTPDDESRDIFVHMKALEKSGLGILEAAQRVRLNVTSGEKGPLAEGVELL